MMKKLALVLILLVSRCCFATVSDGESIRQYFSVDGSTTTFTFTLPGNSADDFKVYKHIITTGVEALLTVDSDYTIAV